VTHWGTSQPNLPFSKQSPPNIRGAAESRGRAECSDGHIQEGSELQPPPKLSTEVAKELLALLRSSNPDDQDTATFFLTAIKQMDASSQALGSIESVNGAALVPKAVLRRLRDNAHDLYLTEMIHPGSGRTIEIRVLLVSPIANSTSSVLPECQRRHSQTK
jgi:hypothetical protein